MFKLTALIPTVVLNFVLTTIIYTQEQQNKLSERGFKLEIKEFFEATFDGFTQVLNVIAEKASASGAFQSILDWLLIN